MVTMRLHPPPQAAPPPGGFRGAAARRLRQVVEAVVLVLVAVSPWALGGVDPFEPFLLAAVAGLLALWGLHGLLAGQVTWQRCPVALCLAGLVLFGVAQAVPLPRAVLDRVSPATGRLYDVLLPTEPEVLPSGERVEPPAQAAGSTLSLCPLATRAAVAELFAVLALFLVVRNLLPAAAGLRRLAVVSLINGALLSFFALVQWFTSPPTTLYWTLPTDGQGFGPFVGRNHFSFYVNICIGLAAGLLLRWPGEGADRGGTRGRQGPRPVWDGLPPRFLEDPRPLWVCLGLMLMLAAALVSLSRGGFLALAGAAVVCLVLPLLLSRRVPRLGYVVLAGAGALALLLWFGLGPLEARLGTIARAGGWGGRLPLWARTLPLFDHFPYWGTGYGTFVYVEPLYRTTAADAGLLFSHAHNDYLEALVEGGLVRLVLSLLALGLVLQAGYRAARSGRGAARGLAWGALLGVTTVAIHSLGDFGLHIPAIAILTTVVCAYLAGLGGASPAAGGGEGGAGSKPLVLRLGGLAPALGAVAAGTFAAGLGWAAWEAWQVEVARIELATRAEAEGAPSDRTLDRLEARVAGAPESVSLEVETGRLELKTLEARLAERADRDLAGAAARGVLVPASAGLSPAAGFAWLSGWAARQELGRDGDEQLARAHLVPGLRHVVRARDLCPLLPGAQDLLAEYAEQLQGGGSRLAYLERAKLVAPHDATRWYLCGKEWLGIQDDRAWENWRHSLALSEKYLPEILEESARRLDRQAILERVLPDRADEVLDALGRLFPEGERSREKEAYLRKELALLEGQPGPPTAKDLHAEAFVRAGLGQDAEAVPLYAAALAQEPQQRRWRYELARLYRRQRRVEEARQQVLILLKLDPGYAEAQELLKELSRGR